MEHGSKQPTFEEIVDLAAALPVKWKVIEPSKYIRCGRNTCPLVALAGETGQYVASPEVMSLGLSHDVRGLVVEAADYGIAAVARGNRAYMMRAFGLAE